MAIIPDPKRIETFATERDFEAWLAKHHDSAPELWIKIHKKGSGLPSITVAQALDVALCWGWIDTTRKGFDESSFLQRYTRRRKRSVWSQINRDHVARLIAARRMTEHGLREIDAAKADGRWDKAYAPMRATTEASIPSDLRAAINANPRAKQTYATLNKANLFSLAYRTNHMKTAAGRAKKIAELVAMLARGETVVPQSSAAKRGTRKEPPKQQRRKKKAPTKKAAKPSKKGRDR